MILIYTIVNEGNMLGMLGIANIILLQKMWRVVMSAIMFCVRLRFAPFANNTIPRGRKWIKLMVKSTMNKYRSDRCHFETISKNSSPFTLDLQIEA